MLQRIQTVYLFIAIILGVVALLNPVAIFLQDDTAVTLGAFTHTAPEGVEFIGAWPLGLLWILAIILAGAAISQFKNRSLQMKLALLAAIELLVTGALQFILASLLGSALGDSYTTNYGWTVGLPFIAMILVVMARAAIKKDDNLVKSVDRLR